MEHIVNNPALDPTDVAILCWASENTHFTQDLLGDRFPDLYDEHCGDIANHLQNLCQQFYLSCELDSAGVDYYTYIPPPEAADIPPLFKEFCQSYKAAGGEVTSMPFCWGVMKKHKGYKSYIKLLGQALDAQVADRERKKQKGAFVAEWRALKRWIKERGWEDLVSDDAVPSAPESEEMKQYTKWLLGKYGATAKPLLTDAQYVSFVKGTGSFSRINTLLGYSERVYIFEHAHTSYFGNATAGLNCYDFLVKLYKAKSE